MDGGIMGRPGSLYIINKPRWLTDPTHENQQITDWYPANPISEKLWRCIEPLKDLENLLEDSQGLKNANKKRRRLKVLITPLYSLFQAIRNLKNYYDSASEYRDHKDKKHIRTVWEQFVAEVPQETIQTIRDKLSGHIDKKLSPEQATQILANMTSRDIGIWIHLCIFMLIELLNLENIYAWSTEDCPPGCVKLMTAESVLVTIKIEDNKPQRIEEMEFVYSPRYEISEICKQVIQTSQWMFRPEDPKIEVEINVGDTYQVEQMES